MRAARDVLEIGVRELSPRHAASVRTKTATRAHLLTRTIALLHELVMDAVGQQGLAPAGPLFARFHGSGDEVDIEAGLPLAQTIRPVGVVVASTLPEGPVLTALLNGDVREHQSLRAVLVAHALRRGYGVRGAPWENYLVEERDTRDRSEWLTEICLPVARSPSLNRLLPAIAPLRVPPPSSAGDVLPRHRLGTRGI